MEQFKMKIKLTILLISLCFNISAEDIWKGKPAPSFDLPDQNGTFHTLKEYQGQWIILYFYPKDDTPGCTTEAKNFTTEYETIKELGAVIIGASLDDIESHKEFAKKYEIPYTLLADKDEIMATDYGVIKKVPFMHYAKRQTFIINPKGVVAKFYEDVNPSSHTQDIIADLKNLQLKYK